jgi:putative ABC transport system substrate-binding protein
VSALTRRRFVWGAGVAGLGLLASCGRLPWQPPEPTRVPHVGWLGSGPPGNDAAFREGLRDYDYVDGQNIAVEWRGGVDDDDLPIVAAELVQRNVDVIVTGSTPAALAAKRATATLPIVMGTSFRPVELGLVESFPKPGGNVTGLSNVSSSLELNQKRLQLLTQSLPEISRIGVIWYPPQPDAVTIWEAIQIGAADLGVSLQSFEVREPADFEALLPTVTQARPNALLMLGGAFFGLHRAAFLDFMARTRLPTMYLDKSYVVDGGLMAYAPSFDAQYRRAAYFVDRILKGAKPGDLPVEQPTTFDFVINLRTAQALGLTIPQHVLLQATEIIQ